MTSDFSKKSTSAVSHWNSPAERLFVLLTAAFCVILVLTNVLGVKLFAVPFVPGLALSVGDLTYPLTFLITDVVTEVWGAPRARFLVRLGFVMSIFTLLLSQFAITLPPHEAWVGEGNRFGYENADQFQNAFLSVFRTSQYMVPASMIAYLCAQTLDVNLFAAIKRWTHGKHLWLRNNVATACSQLLDTAIFCVIFLHFGLGIAWIDCWHLAKYQYCFKIFFALCDTPFCYAGRALARYLIDSK